ncbi:MAG: thiamine diphosphokinase [Candidatus Poseidoniaceae archaeon]
MGRVLIVANGEWPSSFNLQHERTTYDQLVALDGAANRLLELNIIPDVIVGDLDSITTSVLNQCESSGVQIVRIPSQEKSDISKGLQWVQQEQPNARIDVIGIEIGRYDHHLAAYSALFECQSSATILLNGWTAKRVDSNPTTFQVKPDAIISLIAFGSVQGVTLEGCQYPLQNASLTTGTQGVSNKAIESEIIVSAQSGNLLLLIEG